MLPVVILAGGLATRMKPITEKIPKSLIDIKGKPFIYYQLKLLEKNDVDYVILCLGHLGEQVVEYLNSKTNFVMQIDYSFDGEKLLGTGGAIKYIGSKLPEVFFVLYGDSYLDVEYKKIESVYFTSGKKGLMTIFKNDDQWDSSNVIFKNNKLIKYSKKDKSERMNYIDYGLGILNKKVFAKYSEHDSFDLAGIYEELSECNELYGYEVFNRFYEIGSKNGLKEFIEKIDKYE
jgi:NDP-sugar pyrophosphorylase family protein